MTTRAGYRSLFVHANSDTQDDIQFLKAELPKDEKQKEYTTSDVVRIALRFTRAKLVTKKTETTTQG